MKTIRGKMLLWFGMVITILLITLGYAMSRMINNSIVPLIEDMSVQTTLARANEIGHWVNSHAQCISNLSELPVFKEGSMDDIQGYLASQSVLKSEDFELLFFADAKGDYYTSQGHIGNISHREYFQQLVSGQLNNIVTNSLISNSTGHQIFVIAHSVTDNNNNNIGIVAATITLDTLTDITSQVNLADGGFGWVVDGSGLMIAHRDDSLRNNFNILYSTEAGYMDLAETGHSMISGLSGVGMYTNPDGEKMITTYNPIPNTPGWSLGMSINEKDLFQRANLLFRRIGLLMLSILGAVVILIDILSGIISRPLSAAVSHLTAISSGDFSVHLPDKYLKGKDEVSNLARGIESMQNSIDSLIKRTRFLAYHDDITGLPNRVSFLQAIQKYSKEFSGTDMKFGILSMDIDNFKDVNDTMGHTSGDKLLKDVADVLSDIMANCSFEGEIFRYGGDQFILLIKGIHTSEDLKIIVDSLILRFKQPFRIKNQDFYTSVSIGGVIYPQHGMTGEILLQKADLAMNASKDSGKARYRLFEEQMNHAITMRLDMEKSLRKGIAKKEFFLCYQPIISSKTGCIEGVEALIRWQHPIKGLIAPYEFIPLAEETGLIEQIGEWVIREACRQNKEWQDKGYQPFSVSVNISIRQLQNENFVNLVKGILDETGLAPEYLELELTETVFMKYINTSNHILDNLMSLGVKISLDDFGTGYSSLSYLKNLPINTLKVDKSFVSDIETDKERAITGAIIILGHQLNMEIVAEGVETCRQFEFLSSHGCDRLQGYLFSKPLTADVLEELMDKGNMFFSIFDKESEKLSINA